MSNIDKRVLREAAERASTDNHTQDEWFHYLRCSTPETVLALLDELEAAENRIAELKNDEVRQRLANAEHQLHMAELAKHNLRASRKAQFRKRKAAEKRIAEMSENNRLLCADSMIAAAPKSLPSTSSKE